MRATRTAALASLLAAPTALAQQAPPPPSVTVTPAALMKVAETRSRVGQTVAVEDVQIVARVQGEIVKRTSTEGADVQAGDLLYVIDQAPFQAEVARAAADLAIARAELTRAKLALTRNKELRAKGSVSQSALDDAVAAEEASAATVKAREAALRSARINLSYTEVKAPISGRIGRSFFSIGDLVGPDSGTLTEIVTMDPIRVTWGVSEGVLLDARRRNLLSNDPDDPAPQVKARIKFSDGSEYDETGRIDFLDNRVSRTTGTQTARAVFPNPDGVLLPGQYVQIELTLGEAEESLVIPQSAVQENAQGRFVMVVDKDNIAQPRPVTLGDRAGIHWVVESGLAEGEMVIFQGVQKVRPGSPVQPVVSPPRAPVGS